MALPTAVAATPTDKSKSAYPEEYVLIPKALVKEMTQDTKGQAETAVAPAGDSKTGAAPTADVKSSDVRLLSLGGMTAKEAFHMLRARGGKKGKGALAYGTKPVCAKLPVSFQMISASGICSQVVAVDVTNSVEWTALAGLFDEYRLVGGEMHYHQCVGGNLYSPDGIGVMAWDPTDGVNLTSTRNGAELMQHQLTGSASMSVSGATINSAVNMTDGRLRVFRFKTARVKNLHITSNGSISAAPGMWKQMPIAGQNVAYDGYFKCYLNHSHAPAVTMGFAGICWYEVELRARA